MKLLVELTAHGLKRSFLFFSLHPRLSKTAGVDSSDEARESEVPLCQEAQRLGR